VTGGVNDNLAKLSQWFVADAGGYLRNTLRISTVTCGICTTPVDGYARCWQCNDTASQHGSALADLVVPIFYGVHGHQSGYLMQNYKGRGATKRLRALPAIGLRISWNLHRECVFRRLSSYPTVAVTIPSTAGRIGVHPLEVVVREACLEIPRTTLIAAVDQGPDKREIRADRFLVPDPNDIRGKHVLIIDDTWTTGGRAQSACLTLRATGASMITVWTVARWLNPKFGTTQKFISENLQKDFNPIVCPVDPRLCGIQATGIPGLPPAAF
jgi:hypothetical protein